MAKRFEQSGTLNTDYGIVQDIENRRVKTSVSLKKLTLIS